VAALFLIAGATQITPDLGHVPFDGPFLQVQAPPIPDRAHVVLAGDKPTAFVALALGAGHDYIRVGGNHAGALRAPWAVDQRVAAALDRDSEPVVIVLQEPLDDVRPDLARFGLDADEAQCAPLSVSLLNSFDAPIRACPGRRARPASAALADAREQWGKVCTRAVPGDTWLTRQCRAYAASAAGHATTDPSAR
jgi:hypothetical protein